MPTLINHSERPFEFPVLHDKENAAGVRQVKKTIKVPRAKEKKNEDSQEMELVPGSIEISAEDLKQMREHHIAKAWFKPVKGVVRLEVSADEAKAK